MYQCDNIEFCDRLQKKPFACVYHLLYTHSFAIYIELQLIFFCRVKYKIDLIM